MAEAMTNSSSNTTYAEELKDTMLEDMLSFKLGQEGIVHKIIFEDSDEDTPEDNDDEELLSSSDEENRTTPYTNNVIILGTKKAYGKRKTVETNKNHTKKIESAKKNIEIPTEINNKKVEIMAEVDQNLKSVKCDVNEDKNQNNTGTSGTGLEGTNGLGPNECTDNVINNTHECTTPLIVHMSTPEDQPSEPKKCKRDFPRIKVTSTRDVMKFHGKMDAILKDSNKSALPVTSDTSSVDYIPSPTNNYDNLFHVNVLLTIVAENLLVIFPTLNVYTTLNKTDGSFEAVKTKFEAMKLYYFGLSYTTTLSIIVPNKANIKFMTKFYNLAEQLAMKRQTYLFSLDKFVILCDEMIVYTEQTRQNNTRLLTNPQEIKPTEGETPTSLNNEKSSELLKMLQAPQKPLPQVSCAESKYITPLNKRASIVTIKAGPPGREIEIKFDTEKHPQFSKENSTNHQKYNQDINQPTSFSPASTPSVVQPNNQFKINQPGSIANNNQNETRLTTPVMKPNQLFNHTLNSNDKIYQPPTTASADSNNICKTNVLINDHSTPIAAANLPLHFLDSFNTYFETSARDSSNLANASNCENNIKKRGRPSQKKITELQMREGMANQINNKQQSTYPAHPPPPYPGHIDQQYLPWNNQMPQTYITGYHKGSPMQQQYNSSVNTNGGTHLGFQKMSPVQQPRYLPVCNYHHHAPHHLGVQKMTPVQYYGSTINSPAPHHSGYQKQSPVQQNSSAINPPAPHHLGFHSMSSVQHYGSTMNSPAPHHSGYQKQSPVQQNSSAINPPAPHHLGFHSMSSVQHYGSTMNSPAPHHSGYQKQSPVLQKSCAINPPASHHSGNQKLSPVQQNSSAINPPAPHHLGFQKVSSVQHYGSTMHLPAPHHSGYQKQSPVQQYSSAINPPAPHHLGSQQVSPVQQNSSAINPPARYHLGYQKVSPVQQLNSAFNPPPLQERSSVSRDSGFMSPLNETYLNMLDHLDFPENAAAESPIADVTKFKDEQIGATPVITYVTSLDPNAVLNQPGNCSVCRERTNLRCMRCNLVYYCNYDCQLKDSTRHINFCEPAMLRDRR